MRDRFLFGLILVLAAVMALKLVSRRHAQTHAARDRGANRTAPMGDVTTPTSSADQSSAGTPIPLRTIHVRQSRTPERVASAAPAMRRQKSSTPAPEPVRRPPLAQKNDPAPEPAEEQAEEPLIPSPVARLALGYVGSDPDAEEIWVYAINDPNRSPDERKDLIEDLNEDGFPDPRNITEDDVPLIMSRLELIEELAPDAADDVNAAAFAEAYKDLVNMLAKAQGQN